MNVETTVDPNDADRLVTDLHRVLRDAEPALTDTERETLEATIEWIEDAACIETGERLMDNPATDMTYRVTRWIDAGDGNVIALSKQEVEDGE